MRSSSLALVPALLGSLAACDGGVGSGVGSVDGSIYVRQCAQRPAVGSSNRGDAYSLGSAAAPAAYNMNPTFFAAEPIDDFPRLYPNNRLNIRVQSDGARIEQADVLFINIGSVRPVAEALGTPVRVGPNTNVRATLSLNQSCQQPEVSPALEGEITFTQLGSATAGGRIDPNFRISYEDPLQASFDLRVIDVRAATLGGVGVVPTDPALGGALTGNFEFIVYQGQRAQAFP